MAHSKYTRDRRVRYATVHAVCGIQALWRRKSLYTAFKQYQAARKIQSIWRSKTLTNEYKVFKRSLIARSVHNSAALRIQTSWRAVSLQTAFTQYIAARSIQANWRRKLIQLAYLQFLACRRIQANWRGKIVRTAYNEFLATRQLQESYYRKLVVDNSTGSQVEYHGKTHLQPHTSTKQSAATNIAAAWRGFSTCQRYWHILGSVIEIQTIVRGWIARRQLRYLQENAFVQLRTINSLKYKSIARARNSRDRNEKKRVDRAARTIQRFFLMVKAEVDREIRAEKKRRRVKKKSKRKSGTNSFDEKLLENVWRKTIEDDAKYLEYKSSMKALAVAAHIQNNENHTIPKLVTKGSEDSRFSTGRDVTALCGTVGTPMSASGRLGVVPLSVNSFKIDHDVNSKAVTLRSSKSRLSSMSPREIDEDSLLEEAWIDSKINCAKERRGGHRVIDPYQSTRSTKMRSNGPSEYTLPPTMPMRRPPRRTQVV